MTKYKLELELELELRILFKYPETPHYTKHWVTDTTILMVTE